ncbi:hypothetical protein NM688_g7227 [Phlebia brevispora]|uniref:Uncharacterized protein n=1 Tax=Phlebia brevispora TaxID=194682 RepID=A0ACC1S7S7_9APHY|nr:hypothetical protein NM688_g7227 [Phlebia brevispora]
MSPIHLSSSTVHKANLSKASTPCSSTKRRRTHPTTSRTTRRRHCARPDCVVTYANGLHAFDQLPWISQIESESPETVDAWNVADLSLLPDPPSSGIGPVRNRRTSSSRSGVKPLGGIPDEMFASSTGPVSSGLRSRRELLPLQLLPAADNDALNPRTPPPNGTFNPYEVTFRNLMPAFPPNRDECRTPGSRPCMSDSSPLLPSPM